MYVVELDAAIVSPPSTFVYAFATVPDDEVSVSVAAAEVNFIPLVVQAAALRLPLSASAVADATPRVGDTRVGLVANTSAPEPVSSVTAEARLALLGVARNVAIPVPRPLTPVEIGSPVQLVRVPEVGVPSTGVVNDGDVVMATLPDPLMVYSPSTPALS